MASRAQNDLREVSTKIISIVAYALFWIAAGGGALIWLILFERISSTFGFGAAFLGSLAVLTGWLGAVAATGILVMLVEIHRVLKSRK